VIRSIALEMERIAIHVGGLSAMCTDIAFQLGASVYGAIKDTNDQLFSVVVRKQIQ